MADAQQQHAVTMVVQHVAGIQQAIWASCRGITTAQWAGSNISSSCMHASRSLEPRIWAGGSCRRLQGCTWQHSCFGERGGIFGALLVQHATWHGDGGCVRQLGTTARCRPRHHESDGSSCSTHMSWRPCIIQHGVALH
jgi:hypothetical protein